MRMRRLVTGSESEAVGGAMDGECEHHGRGNFAEAMTGGFVEMAGGTSGTDVIDVFRNDEKKEITRLQCYKNAPPFECLKSFRDDRERCHTQKRACSQADE